MLASAYVCFGDKLVHKLDIETAAVSANFGVVFVEIPEIELNPYNL